MQKISILDEFKLLAQKYNFKIRNNSNNISLCAKNTDGRWENWITYNLYKNSVAIVGNTDQCNFWFCNTRPDFTPEKLMDFVSELNEILNKIGYTVELKTLIDPEDWQEIAKVQDAYEDERYSGNKKKVMVSDEGEEI